jgi:uncharacterized membrane protein
MVTLADVFDFIFGCHHGQLSRVFTIDGRTYQVCCNCGARFTYSLSNMRIQRPMQSLEAQNATIS